MGSDVINHFTDRAELFGFAVFDFSTKSVLDFQNESYKVNGIGIQVGL